MVKDYISFIDTSQKGENTLCWNPLKGFQDPLAENKKDPPKNKNFFLTGKNCPQKSKFCEEIIISTIEEGGNVLVFDRGRKYYGLVLCTDGDYLTEENKFCINPFLIMPEGDSAQDVSDRTKIFNLLSTLLLMLAFPFEAYRDEDELLVKEALKAVWEKNGSYGKIQHVIKVLESQDGLRGAQLAEALESYVCAYEGDLQGVLDFLRFQPEGRSEEIASNISHSLGHYNSFFSDKHSDLFDPSLSVVDVSGFDGFGAQLTITQLLIQAYCYQQNHYKPKPFLIVFEDFSFDTPTFAFSSFIKSFSRVAREQNISIGRVSNGIMDTGYSAVSGQSILEQSFKEISNWEVFFREENPKVFKKFSKENNNLFSEADLKHFDSLYDGTASFCMKGSVDPLRPYTKHLKGEKTNESA